jgi:hypothetical protein
MVGTKISYSEGLGFVADQEAGHPECVTVFSYVTRCKCLKNTLKKITSAPTDLIPDLLFIIAIPSLDYKLTHAVSKEALNKERLGNVIIMGRRSESSDLCNS